MFVDFPPRLGMVFGFLSLVAMFRSFGRNTPAWRCHALLVGTVAFIATYALGNSTPYAQRTMRIIAFQLYTAGLLGPTFYVPTWVVFATHGAIGLGTYLGGWKAVCTMGMKLSDLRRVHGFCAETSSAFGCRRCLAEATSPSNRGAAVQVIEPPASSISLHRYTGLRSAFGVYHSWLTVPRPRLADTSRDHPSPSPCLCPDATDESDSHAKGSSRQLSRRETSSDLCHLTSYFLPLVSSLALSTILISSSVNP